MCRLFGLVANKEVNIEFSLSKADLPFKSLSYHNPHGWGVGYFKNDNAIIQKQPLPAHSSSKFQDITKNIKSRMFVSHVRYSTQGGKTYQNTHPFKFKNWIFAHNGNIDIKDLIKQHLIPKYLKRLEGETDSEVFFYLLIQNINKYGITKGITNAIDYIKENKRDKTTSLNFLLTNGEKYYALRQAFTRVNFYSLYYLERNPQDDNVELYSSKELKFLINSKNLHSEKAVVICSEQLTNEENWISLDNNFFLIIDKNLNINVENI